MGRLRFELQNLIILPFHADPLQQVLRLCVHFLMSMKHFVRMIQGWFLNHSQSSRRLRHLVDDLPSVFQSDAEPPRIGAPVQPPPPAARRPDATQGVDLLSAATPMTPGHPPRPPLEALPKYPSMEMSSSANKHPLDPSTAQGPPSKHVRSKAFPYASQPPDQIYVAASATVDMSQVGTPCPKGPPAAYMPTPPEITTMPTSTEERRSRMNDEGKCVKIRSVLDIDWNRPLWEQLAPVLKGGPSPSRFPGELRAIRAKVPDLTNQLFEGIFPADNVITAVQKSHGVHKIHMREVAAWVLNMELIGSASYSNPCCRHLGLHTARLFYQAVTQRVN